MVGILDEAANVCRWRDLPDLYSHYGSRGFVLMTILQSWSQGEEVWGRAGMNKLWSASNEAIYGRGRGHPGDRGGRPVTCLGEWEDAEDQEVEEIGDEQTASGPELYFGSVDEFVREMIVPVFRRLGSGTAANSAGQPTGGGTPRP